VCVCVCVCLCVCVLVCVCVCVCVYEDALLAAYLHTQITLFKKVSLLLNLLHNNYTCIHAWLRVCDSHATVRIYACMHAHIVTHMHVHMYEG